MTVLPQRTKIGRFYSFDAWKPDWRNSGGQPPLNRSSDPKKSTTVTRGSTACQLDYMVTFEKLTAVQPPSLNRVSTWSIRGASTAKTKVLGLLCKALWRCAYTSWSLAGVLGVPPLMLEGVWSGKLFFFQTQKEIKAG